MAIKKIVGLGLFMALPVCGINFSFAGEDSQAYESMETGEASLMEDSEAYTDANIIGGNIYYNPDTGEITSCDKEVISAVIPSSINGVRITSIGGRAFYKCENLIKAEIPEA